MEEPRQIRPADLLVDANNPRLSEPSTGQRETLRALTGDDQRKLLTLAEDILRFGLNPADLPIVMPSNDESKRFFVLEGNRRIAAVKALENPEVLVGALTEENLTSLRKLSREYHSKPIEMVRCLVVGNRDEAHHWIELRHTGENGGAGIVPWGSEDAARFRARSGRLEIHSQALELLEANGLITPQDRRKVPATSFKRLLGTPEVREKLGIDLVDGELRLRGNEAAVGQALLHVANELITGRIKTSDIYTKDQRIAYANSLPQAIVVKPSKKEETTKKAKGKQTKKKATKKTQREGPRDNLIPSDCELTIKTQRIQDIERELRNLSLETYANAISVLFRVFIELSVDAYADTRKLPVDPDVILTKKIDAVMKDLLQRQKLTSQQATPVRRACQRDSFLAPSVTMMHQYVHNKHVFPIGSDLRAYWDNLQPFVLAMWS